MFKLFQTNTVPGEHEEGSTWLELFFDLIYVAVLVELGNRLSHNLSLHGTLEFAVLYVPILWSWLGLVFYTRYFPADDIGQRILTVIYMGAMILLAFEIHAVTASTASLFLLAYAATKFVVALMYGRAWKEYPEYRSLTSHFATINILIGCAWVVIALMAPTNLWLWAVVIAADVLTPLFIRWSRQIRKKPKPAHPPLKHHYMLHRFGELTIIVLGEFFIKLVTTSSDREVSFFNLFMGGCLLLISVSLWWLYFDHTGHTELDAKRTRPAVWVYMHYFLLASITAYGVVGTHVFAAIPGEILVQEDRLLFCLALAVAVVALGIIDWASPEAQGRRARSPQLNVRIGAAVVLILLAIVGGRVDMGVLVALVTLVLLVQVGLDIGLRLKNKAAGAAVVVQN